MRILSKFGLLAGQGVEFGDAFELVAEERQRQARSSTWAGQISSMSPRTRKVPRLKSMSLRR